MCIRDSLGNGDGVYRALVDAFAASDALVHVDVGHVVHHFNSFHRAGFLALHAANAARGACLAGQRATVMVGAQNHGLLALGTHLNDVLGTCLLYTSRCV